MSIIRNYLFNKDKLEYVKDKRPNADCILCAIAGKSPGVKLLDIYRTDNFIVSVNLYPYNPGHVLLFPFRHIEDLTAMSEAEVLELHGLTVKTISILKDEYKI